MKFIKLLTSAYVNGQLRHPHEGVLHLEDDAARRLLDNQSGEDVTGDFTAEENETVPVEGLRASDNDVLAAARLDPVEHQADIAPGADTAETGDEIPAADGSRKTKAK